MALDTVMQQGRFTATGNNIALNIRSDLDWMMVYNTTIAAGNQTTAVGVKYYWQRGFPAGAKWTTFKSNAAAAANLDQYLTTNGFTLVDTSASPLGTVNNTITAISTAAIPVATNTGVNGLAAGNVVRLTNVVGAPQLGGYDFTVGYNTLSNTTFSLDYMEQLSVAGTTASWRVVNFDPIFYPSHRTISKITQAAQAVVTLTVTHGFTVGQEVRFVIPEAFGMTELNGLQGEIVAIDTTTTTGNTITVDIDTTAFSAFAFPLAAAVPFSPALVVPIGEAAVGAFANSLDDATRNTAFIGIILAGGAGNPGGAVNDVMYWVAGKSFSVDNQ